MVSTFRVDDAVVTFGHPVVQRELLRAGGTEAHPVVVKKRFLPVRRYASAGNSHSNVSVCPSVRVSRAGIVPKRKKLAA